MPPGLQKGMPETASPMETSRRTNRTFREWVVYDEYSRCPYLPGQIARLPLRLPSAPLSPEALSERLAAGDRRQGILLYRPRCPGCQACEAIRLEVASFHWGRTLRRIWRRGETLLRTEIGPPTMTPEKVALYNRHKVERNLLVGDGLLDEDLYHEFLVDSCADTFEIDYYLEDRLVGVAITDRAVDSLSAVYCFYDPTVSGISLGTYSILKQLDLCRQMGLSHLYLGLFVAGCRSMAYKTRFRPHERLVDGEWQRVD